jgi:hypothetical protein
LGLGQHQICGMLLMISKSHQNKQFWWELKYKAQIACDMLWSTPLLAHHGETWEWCKQLETRLLKMRKICVIFGYNTEHVKFAQSMYCKMGSRIWERNGSMVECGKQSRQPSPNHKLDWMYEQASPPIMNRNRFPI